MKYFYLVFLLVLLGFNSCFNRVKRIYPVKDVVVATPSMVGSVAKVNFHLVEENNAKIDIDTIIGDCSCTNIFDSYENDTLIVTVEIRKDYPGFYDQKIILYPKNHASILLIAQGEFIN